jgi:dienelactone hydrolase
MQDAARPTSIGRRLKRLGGLAAFLGLAGCATVPPAPQGWVVRDVTAGGHLLTTAAPAQQRSGRILTVVIEGDGPAHDAGGRASADPTPRRPQGLAIAQAWPQGPVAWLARPCQYTRARDPACARKVWSRDRFAEAALAAADAGVTALRDQAGAERVNLVGWSGGGTLAAALAGHRTDVAGLVTFAAPLDVDGWTVAQGLTPLPLSPQVRGMATLRLELAQVHRLGARDRIVPAAANLAAARRMGGDVAIADEAHDCCWARRVIEAADALERQRTR